MKKNQKTRVREYLEYNGTITSLDGLKFSPPIVRITAVVDLLKKDGIDIDSVQSGTGFVYYTLKKES